MIFLALCVQVLLLNLADRVTIADINYHESKNSSSKFAVLLKDLIQINEERFETLKQLTKLQEHTIRHGLRTKPELALGDNDAQKRLLVIFLGKRNPIKREQVLINNAITLSARTTQSASSEETADSGSFEVKNGSALFYRQGMSARYKYCKDACRSTLEDVCMEYSCSSRLKKRFRKGCKRRCKEAVQI